MQATLLVRRRAHHGEGLFSEVVIWLLPPALAGSHYRFKYRLALIHNEVCALRYDNQSGKGDHRHAGTLEEPYPFTTMEQQLADFEDSVRSYVNEHAHHRQSDR